MLKITEGVVRAKVTWNAVLDSSLSVYRILPPAKQPVDDAHQCEPEHPVDCGLEREAAKDREVQSLRGHMSDYENPA